MAFRSRPHIVTARVNVLVYSGQGTSEDCVRHSLASLRALLSASYAVTTIGTTALLHEPWMSSCALLVIPGGADLPYCELLNGAGTRRITQYVKKGGAVLAFCAGAYFASARCEFEVDDEKMRVVGDRELALFPGVCRGTAFKGFSYGSVAGARAVALAVHAGAGSAGLDPAVAPEGFKCYYNGGGVFVDASAARMREMGVEVLASYVDKLAVDGGEAGSKAAAVFRRIEQGAALLVATHPEYDPAGMDKSQGGPAYSDIIEQLRGNDDSRRRFLRACLLKLGLRANDAAAAASVAAVPAASQLHLHLSGADEGTLAMTIGALRAASTSTSDGSVIQDAADQIRLVDGGQDQRADQAGAEEGGMPVTSNGSGNDSDDRKTLLCHSTAPPAPAETPLFDHQQYYASLAHYQRKAQREHPQDQPRQDRTSNHRFGTQLIYAGQLPSTQTLLEKNPRLVACLPSGTVATTSLQAAGRGRGSNVWVGSHGQLAFSLVIKHPAEKLSAAPVTFIQYLAAMAVVRGIRGYDEGYEEFPVKMKWPNDIYALDPKKPSDNNAYTKVAGILVNAQYAGDEYLAVCGIGLNVLNAAPTASLGEVADRLRQQRGGRLPALSLERLLASILTAFQALYLHFLRTGFDTALEQEYYDGWLHSDQIVTLESEGGARARIRGVTRDWGLLQAEELGWEDRPTGKVFTLQSDSNSFDFMKGLLKRKT
ncbi:biotin holocarboxylase synthetase [Ascosphaera acerosa]|nr:biotin holocarboxylase synthetase [Ascosphaera acerosa]